MVVLLSGVVEAHISRSQPIWQHQYFTWMGTAELPSGSCHLLICWREGRREGGDAGCFIVFFLCLLVNKIKGTKKLADTLVLHRTASKKSDGDGGTVQSIYPNITRISGYTSIFCKDGMLKQANF